jgi:molecular chaperone DnaK
VLQGERQMANDNMTLGRFQLTGIAPAPRGIPQIEVSFDIDANGIVNVSAKDLGTGKEQKITITASSNLTDEEIERKVKESEQFAEEDKKRKEEIEVRNNGDSMVYQTENLLKDLKGKISDEDKSKIESKVEELKKALEGDNTEEIKSKTEELTQEFYAASQKLYEQAGAEGFDPNAGSNADSDDDVVDADFEVVDDDE